VGIWRGALVVCKGAVLMCRLCINFYGRYLIVAWQATVLPCLGNYCLSVLRRNIIMSGQRSMQGSITNGLVTGLCLFSLFLRAESSHWVHDFLYVTTKPLQFFEEINV